MGWKALPAVLPPALARTEAPRGSTQAPGTKDRQLFQEAARAARDLPPEHRLVVLERLRHRSTDGVALGTARILLSPFFQSASVEEKEQLFTLLRSLGAEATQAAHLLCRQPSLLRQVDRKKQTLLSNLAALAVQTPNTAFSKGRAEAAKKGVDAITPSELLDELVMQIAVPGLVRQGPFMTCYTGTQQMALVRERPEEAALLMREMAGTKGRATLADREVVLPTDYLVPRADDSRGAASAVFQTAIARSMLERGTRYDPRKDQIYLTAVRRVLARTGNTYQQWNERLGGFNANPTETQWQGALPEEVAKSAETYFETKYELQHFSFEQAVAYVRNNPPGHVPFFLYGVFGAGDGHIVQVLGHDGEKLVVGDTGLHKEDVVEVKEMLARGLAPPVSHDLTADRLDPSDVLLIVPRSDVVQWS